MTTIDLKKLETITGGGEPSDRERLLRDPVNIFANLTAGYPTGETLRALQALR